MNTITLTGNLTKDPVVYFTKNDKPIVHFDIAENYIDSMTGEKKAQFHHVTAFGKMAETISSHCHKGSKLSLTGTLRDASYEKDGVKHIRWEILLSKFAFCDKAPKKAPAEETAPKE